jgi:hypothetical protein
VIGRRAALKGAAAMAAGGNPRQRPDQLMQPLSRAGVGPAPAPSVIVARKVIIIGSLGELLVYSPTETAGDLIAAIAAQGGSDGLGNAFLQGIGSYNQAGQQAVVLNGAVIGFFYSISSGREYAVLEPTQLGAGVAPALEAAVSTGFIIGSGFTNTEAIVFLAASGDTTGATDRANINSALSILSAGRGGKVVLLPGVFWRDSSIIIDASQVILEGQGSAASVIQAATAASGPAVIVGNTHAVSASGVKGLQITDNNGSGVPVAGSTHGVVYACDAGILEDVVVQAVAGDSFHIGQDLVQFALNTTVTAPSSGAALPAATLNVVSVAGFTSTGSLIVPSSNGPAFCTYTGTSGGTQFTGCTWSFPGTGTTITGGGTVTQPPFLTDLTGINCYAQKQNSTTGNGWYIDWTYSSCEFFACRSQGANTKPASTGTMAGWVVYGQNIKLFGCHAFFWNGFGLQLNDVNVFTGGALSVTGGEWENCAAGGGIIHAPSEACWINPGTQFYGNGLGTGQSDLTLAFGTQGVNVIGATFKRGGAAGVLVAQNIYMQAASHINITGCAFTYPFVPRAIEVDGSGVGNTCSYVFIRDNTFALTNAGSTAVLLNGGTFNSVVAGNYTDASIIEAIDIETPNLNQVYDNVFNPSVGAVLTLVGPDSMAWDNVGAGSYWQAVTIPAGWTGSARVRLLPDVGIFDFNVSIVGNASGTASFGTFPDATFYPLNVYLFALATSGGLVATDCRVNINTASTGPTLAGLPTAGAPSFTVSATVSFPLD